MPQIQHVFSSKFRDRGSGVPGVAAPCQAVAAVRGVAGGAGEEVVDQCAGGPGPLNCGRCPQSGRVTDRTCGTVAVSRRARGGGDHGGAGAPHAQGWHRQLRQAAQTPVSPDGAPR